MIREEAMHCAAMAIRLALNLDRYKTTSTNYFARLSTVVSLSGFGVITVFLVIKAAHFLWAIWSLQIPR